MSLSMPFLSEKGAFQGTFKAELVKTAKDLIL